MNKYLLIRIPKTASTSICQALNESIPHKTAIEWQRELADFNERFKFSIVRNPYQRFISMCKFFQVKPEDFGSNVHFRLQADFLFKGNNLLVDYVGRFEDLDNSWKYICERIGKLYQPLKYKKVNRGDKLKVEDIKDIVLKYYRRDFDLLNYPIDKYE
jgi:hypothetical protein